MRPLLSRKYLSFAALFLVLCGVAAYWFLAPRQEAPEGPVPTEPGAALHELHVGNLRYVNCCRTHSTDTRKDAALRRNTAKGQHPFVAILCCSDSRVVPEFVFDQRAGSIFEIRNAGNVVDEDVLASLEYAVEHLHVPLIV